MNGRMHSAKTGGRLAFAALLERRWFPWRCGERSMHLPMEGFRLRRARISVVVGEPIIPDDFADEPDPRGSMIEAWRSAIEVGIGSDAQAAKG